jgi:excisionase family DNA binding protein
MTERARPTDRARYLTIAEAADYLNVTERFMRRVVAERRIRHYRVGKFLRFDPADLDGFARMGEVVVGESGRATEVWLSARRLG